MVEERVRWGEGTDVQRQAICLLLGRGDGRFRKPQVVDVATAQEGIVPFDVNGDDKPDLVMTGNDTHSLVTLVNHTP